MRKLIKNILISASAVTVLIVLLLYFNKAENVGSQSTAAEANAKAQTWTCSMHPNIKQPKPGKCPICHMDLIPLTADEESPDQAIIKFSPSSQKLAEIETAPVEEKFVTAEVHLSGKIRYDETRMDKISAHFPGRIEELFVNYTGMSIKKGDHIAELFSPELAVLQRELKMTHQALADARQTGRKRALQTAERSFNSVKKKMKIWGLLPKQVNTILNKKSTLENVTLFAPISGVVTKKNMVEGQYFKTGDPLLTIADTDYLWVILDAYELDMPWLHLGQTVKFEVAAYPGDVFSGRLVYIAPELDEKTRTVKVRANVKNTNNKLKPGMFVKAVVYSKIDNNGHVIEDSLAGKWVSPMHPEVIKDQKGQCDICSVDLVPAEALGFVTTRTSSSFPPLVVPASAPLITGKRAVVYVETAPGKYEGREVVLGPRAGRYYIIKKGLKAGDKVVTKGNFKIDSALQIKAKPSMMSMKDSPQQKRNALTAAPFKEEFDILLKAYYKVHHYLSRDNVKKGNQELKKFLKILTNIDDSSLPAADAKHWQSWKTKMVKAAEDSLKQENLKLTRANFAVLSHGMYDIAKTIGTGGSVAVYKQFCPMVGEKGEFWLQDKKELENPYYGSEMFHCGVLQETLNERN